MLLLLLRWTAGMDGRPRTAVLSCQEPRKSVLGPCISLTRDDLRDAKGAGADAHARDKLNVLRSRFKNTSRTNLDAIAATTNPRTTHETTRRKNLG